MLSRIKSHGNYCAWKKQWLNSLITEDREEFMLFLTRYQYRD
jgi:hypothetical protein